MSATLTIKTGEQLTGVFSGANLDGADPHYILKMVKRIPNTPAAANGTVVAQGDYLGTGEDHFLTLPVSDVVDLVVSDVVLEKSLHKVQNGEFNRRASDVWGLI